MTHKQWWLLAVVVAAIGLGFWLAPKIDLQRLVEREQQLKAWIDARPLQAAMLGTLGYTALALIPGTGGKAIVYGWLFGVWSTVVQASLGLTIAATATFLLSRYCLRGMVQRRLPKQVEWLDGALEREGPYVLLTLRLAHAPYTLVNYTLGATSLRTVTFCWCTLLGMLPGTIVFAYAGAQLPSLERLATHGVHALVRPQVVIALVVLAGVPLLLRWALRNRERAADAFRSGKSH